MENRQSARLVLTLEEAEEQPVLMELELTEDDRMETEACDEIFPDGWIDFMEQEQVAQELEQARKREKKDKGDAENAPKEMSMWEELILYDDIYLDTPAPPAPNRVHTENDAPDLIFELQKTPQRYAVYVRRRADWDELAGPAARRKAFKKDETKQIEKTAPR
ncbi:unnamed protein product [Caenorhabditis sp. 36 PRJEB53466]|nr:unnamed protein product [Caenorhabditis sp. 36 PRJEB53466]